MKSVVKWVTALFGLAWGGKVPADLKNSDISPLYRKMRQGGGKYRGINLLSVPRMALGTILIVKLITLNSYGHGREMKW